MRPGVVRDVPLRTRTEPPEIVNQTFYFLNKSKTKWVCVGLAPHLRLTPIVKICGKGQGICFGEAEWKQFVDSQGILLNYFYATDTPWPAMHIGPKTIYFQTINQKRIVKIQDMDENELYLGYESVIECVELLQLIEHRLDMLKSQQFNNYYNNMINTLATMPGDFKVNIKTMLQSNKDCANACAMKELVHFNSEKIAVDLEVARVTM